MAFFKNKVLSKLFIAAIVIILLEVFIFNFSAFLTFSVENEETLDLKNAVLSNFTVNDDASICITGEAEGSITFYDIDKDIDTIYIDAVFNTAEKEIEIDYTEETYSHFWRHDGSISVINSNEQSKYTICNFSGKADNLRFKIECDEKEEVLINSIVINKKIPLNISPLRVLTIFLFAAIVIILANAKAFNRAVAAGRTFSNTSVAIIGVFLIVALLLSSVASYGLFKDFTEPKTNQINKELVDAFIAGQVELLREVEPELLALENPYDWSEREIFDVKYAWDHCLYNGNYYSYYGIAPVLLLFLPYTLLTGTYFPPVWAIFIFAVLGIIFLGKTYEIFVKKFFPSLHTGVALCGLIVIEAASGIWYCLPIPNFYEIAQSSGFAFVSIGAYFMLSSNVISKGKLSIWKAALSSLFLALAVLCRPTLAVYCIVALVFIILGSKKAYKIGKKTKLSAYLCATLVPFIVIGSIQMTYNFLRFDSFFDFGIQYSLTINDFTRTEYHLPLALVGFYNFLFAPPVFSDSFPFIFSNYSELGVNGYYFSANKNAVGILFRALPVFSYLYGIKGYKLCKNKTNAILLMLVSIAAPLVIIFSIWESGYGVRYCADFYWQIIIGALAIAYTVYINALPSARNVCKKLSLAAVPAAILVNGALMFDYLIENTNATMQAALLSFGRLFEFWSAM